MSANSNPYEIDLDRNAANHAPLTPLGFLRRSAAVHPDRLSIIHGDRRYTWSETYARCRRLASALVKRGIGLGDTVAVMAPNVPALYEAHFGVPMAGAVLVRVSHLHRHTKYVHFCLTTKTKEKDKGRIGSKDTERRKANMGESMGKLMGNEETQVHMDNKEYRKQKTSYANTEGGRVSGRNYLRNQLLKQGEC